MPVPKLRGALPSPKHLSFATKPVRPRAVPSTFGIVPPVLHMWGNSQYGDCVTAEEAFAKAAYSIMAGLPECVINDDVVVQWARRHGYLNGATLTDVMDTMAKAGLAAPDGKTYTDGPYQSVDWTNQATLSTAITMGPVKIAISADQVEQAVNAANDQSGWLLTGARTDRNTDHCVSLCGYGTIADCFALLKLPVPAHANPIDFAVLLFTWQTIGVVDLPSLVAICDEAWERNPTTVGLPTPTPPTPPPSPTPTPTPVPDSGTVIVNIGQYLCEIDWTTPPPVPSN